MPFFEPGLDELLRKNVATGRLRFTTSYEEAGEFGDVHFLCVGTPQKKGEFAADLRYVDAATRDAGARTCGDGALFVGKSTVPAGTARRLAELSSRSAPRGVELAWNPGVPARGLGRPGHAAPGPAGHRRPQRGRAEADPARGLRAAARRPARRWSSPTSRPPSWSRSPPTPSWPPRSPSSTRWPRSARRPAPTSSCCRKALSYDTRIGGRFLHAGLGFGGGCLPKDIRAFMARAGELGVDQALSLPQGGRRDQHAPPRPHGRPGPGADSAAPSPAARVGVLGAAFKPNSDDIRDSPALDVAAASSGRAPRCGSTTRRRRTTPRA